ncbi:hypothetical protein PR048_017965 [Dryococelus australis]|uniref:Uncharacterized protein n=1 Tax=Dryococelus australis TaxID=614101 RepID=A0ABQ9HB34_9NEOP|nr:hypothetical protein PR048_017965 [Dryococelus australis]
MQARVVGLVEASGQDCTSRNARVGETGAARENPPTSGIVWHDYHVRKSGGDHYSTVSEAVGRPFGEERHRTSFERAHCFCGVLPEIHTSGATTPIHPRQSAVLRRDTGLSYLQFRFPYQRPKWPCFTPQSTLFINLDILRGMVYENQISPSVGWQLFLHTSSELWELRPPVSRHTCHSGGICFTGGCPKFLARQDDRVSYKVYTGTRYKCAIASTHKALNWRAVFSSRCVYLCDFQRRPYKFIGGNSVAKPTGVIEVSMEQRWNERTGETGDPRKNPPTNSIVRYDSHMRKSGALVHTVFDVSWRTLAQSSPFTVKTVNQCLVNICIFVYNPIPNNTDKLRQKSRTHRASRESRLPLHVGVGLFSSVATGAEIGWARAAPHVHITYRKKRKSRREAFNSAVVESDVISIVYSASSVTGEITAYSADRSRNTLGKWGHLPPCWNVVRHLAPADLVARWQASRRESFSARSSQSDTSPHFQTLWQPSENGYAYIIGTVSPFPLCNSPLPDPLAAIREWVRIHHRNRVAISSLPGNSGFLHVGIVSDDAAGRRVFPGFSRCSRPFIPALFHTHLSHPRGFQELVVKRRPNLFTHSESFQKCSTINCEQPIPNFISNLVADIHREVLSSLTKLVDGELFNLWRLASVNVYQPIHNHYFHIDSLFIAMTPNVCRSHIQYPPVALFTVPMLAVVDFTPSVLSCHHSTLRWVIALLYSHTWRSRSHNPPNSRTVCTETRSVLSIVSPARSGRFRHLESR